MKKIILILIFCLSIFPYFAQINLSKAIEVGTNALWHNDFFISIQQFNDIIEKRPDLWEPFYYRAVAKYNLGDFVSAKKDCDEALKLNPFIPKSYQLRALCNIKEEQYTLAINDYKKALFFSPEDKDSRYNLALCYAQNKDYKDALSQLDSLYQRSPSLNYLLAQSKVYLQSKDTLQASKKLQQILQKDTTFSEAYFIKGNIALSKQQFQDAVVNYNKAIELNFQDPATYLNRAIAHLKLFNYNAALKDYNQVTTLLPNHYLAHYNRGLLRTEIGDDNKAIEDFNIVLKQNPNNYLALFNRGRLYIQTGNFQDAIKDLTKIIEVYPDFMYSYNLRAKAYRMIGNIKKAMQDEKLLFIYQNNLLNQKNIKKKKTPQKQDINSYNEAIAEEEPLLYANKLRGTIQLTKDSISYLPPYGLVLHTISTFQLKEAQLYNPSLEQINKQNPINNCFIAFGLLSQQPDTFQTLNFSNQLSTLEQSSSNSQHLSYNIYLSLIYSTLKNYSKALTLLNNMPQESFQVLVSLQKTALVMQQQLIQNSFLPPNTLSQLEKELILIEKKAKELSPLCLYNRSLLYIYSNQKQKAQEILDKLLNSYPYFASAYFNKGLLLLEQKQFNQAYLNFSKAGELGIYQAYQMMKQIKKDFK